MREQPLRYRRYVGESKPLIEEFISSFKDDRLLAKDIVVVHAAHLIGLHRESLIPNDAASKIAKELLSVLENPEHVYAWSEKTNIAFEDFFEALESYLHHSLGEIAGYLYLGRSRNDFIAAALRLAAREYSLSLLNELLHLRSILVDKGEEQVSKLFPYFTHLQLAQIGSAAHYFVALEEALSRAWSSIFDATIRHCYDNPLGSGPAIGTTVLLPSNEVNRLLCFETQVTPYYATGSRLFILDLLASLLSLFVELSRFAADMITVNAMIPGLIESPKEHIATSSIMPHKQNLASLELVRAKCGKAIGWLDSVFSILKGLTYGYNLDLQELNMLLIKAFEEAMEVVKVFKDYVAGLNIVDSVLREWAKDKVFWGGELAEELAKRLGIPFREAYYRVAAALRADGWRLGENTRKLLETVGISVDNLFGIISRRPWEEKILHHIHYRREKLANDAERLNTLQEKLQECKATLIRELRMLAGEGF